MTSQSPHRPLPLRTPSDLLSLSGGILVVASSFLGSGLNPLSLPLAAWALLPWAGLFVLGRLVRDPWTQAGGGIALLGGELGARAAVFLFPTSSTAGLLLLFSPLYLLAVALLPGALLGWMIGRCWRLSPWLGAPLATLGLAAVGLLGLSLARPELTPWAVADRQELLEELGPPRVALGRASFEWTLISERPGWALAASLDDQPGEEVALVDHRRVLLLDADGLVEKRRFESELPEGTAGGAWNWFSRLARLDGRLVVVQSGGGYSETELLELDGRPLWRYRPDPKLPPSRLLPADLDGDGDLELYAAEGTRLVRLDGEGQEVWSREAAYGTSLLLAPRTARAPAWVVGSRHLNDKTVYLIWDEAGRKLGEISVPGVFWQSGVADTSVGRLVLVGETTLLGFDLDGNRRLELDLGHFHFQQAAAVRFSATEGDHLAVVGGIPSSEVDRARLLILGQEMEPVYDEILTAPPALITARRADGSDLLLIHRRGGGSEAAGLWRLEPKERDDA